MLCLYSWGANLNKEGTMEGSQIKPHTKVSFSLYIEMNNFEKLHGGYYLPNFLLNKQHLFYMVKIKVFLCAVDSPFSVKTILSLYYEKTFSVMVSMQTRFFLGDVISFQFENVQLNCLKHFPIHLSFTFCKQGTRRKTSTCCSTIL